MKPPNNSEIVTMLVRAAAKLQSVDYNLSDELLALADRVEAERKVTFQGAPIDIPPPGCSKCDQANKARELAKENMAAFNAPWGKLPKP